MFIAKWFEICSHDIINNQKKRVLEVKGVTVHNTMYLTCTVVERPRRIHLLVTTVDQSRFTNNSLIQSVPLSKNTFSKVQNLQHEGELQTRI